MCAVQAQQQVNQLADSASYQISPGLPFTAAAASLAHAQYSVNACKKRARTLQAERGLFAAQLMHFEQMKQSQQQRKKSLVASQKATSDTQSSAKRDYLAGKVERSSGRATKSHSGQRRGLLIARCALGQLG